MTDALTLPQLTSLQAPGTSRPGELRTANEPTTTGDVAIRPFAEVLKSKSEPSPDAAKPKTASKPGEDAEETSADTGSSGLSVLPTIIPAAAPDASLLPPQLLVAQLSAQLSAAMPADLKPADAAALAQTDPAASSPLAHTESFAPLPLATDALPALPASAPLTPAAPTSDLPPELAAALPPSTAVPLKDAGKGHPAAFIAPGRDAARAVAENADEQPRPTMIAVSSANSAESGKVPGERPVIDPAVEFRSLPERLTHHADTHAMLGAQAAMVNPRPASEPAPMHVATPFAQPGWHQEVEQKLSWLVSSSRQQADLVLNPPQLGRIEITLVVEGDQVNASFATPHQAVRDALEESLIRLRESLADAGINLGQTHVGRDSSRDAPFMRAEGDVRRGEASRRDFASSVPQAQSTSWLPARGRGLVDIFA